MLQRSKQEAPNPKMCGAFVHLFSGKRNYRAFPDYFALAVCCRCSARGSGRRPPVQRKGGLVPQPTYIPLTIFGFFPRLVFTQQFVASSLTARAASVFIMGGEPSTVRTRIFSRYPHQLSYWCSCLLASTLLAEWLASLAAVGFSTTPAAAVLSWDWSSASIK